MARCYLHVAPFCFIHPTCLFSNGPLVESLSEFVAVGRSCMACKFVVGVGNLGFVSAENPLLGAI